MIVPPPEMGAAAVVSVLVQLAPVGSFWQRTQSTLGQLHPASFQAATILSGPELSLMYVTDGQPEHPQMLVEMRTSQVPVLVQLFALLTAVW